MVGVFQRRTRRHAELMRPVSGVTAELAGRLLEVNAHLEEFAAGLAGVVERARAAESAAREAGEDDVGQRGRA